MNQKITKATSYGLNNLCWYPFRTNTSILYVGDYNKNLGDFFSKESNITFVSLMDINTINDCFDYIIVDTNIDFVEDKCQALELLINYLKSDGNLILMTNNKLALKYFAGAKDNQFNELYGAFNSKSTLYTKKQWELLFDGLKLNYKFYYPFPNVQVTTQILTDEWMKSGLNLEYEDDHDFRFINFDEEYVYKSLRNSGEFQNFSNSFFIVLGEEENIVYSKISSERISKYQIFTNIISRDGKLKVEKKAISDEGIQHINTIYEFYKQNKIENSFYQYCPVIKKDKSLFFDFIEGKNLEELIEDCVEKQDYKSVEKYVDVIYQILTSQNIVDFEVNTVFKDVFGEYEFNDSPSIYFCNIDLIPENIIRTDDGYTIIDFEWFFKCTVPVNFVMYRAILHSPSLSRLPHDVLNTLYRKYNISEDLKNTYYKMELNFQDYVSDQKIEHLFDSKNCIRIRNDDYKKNILKISDSNDECIFESYKPHFVDFSLEIHDKDYEMDFNGKSIFKIKEIKLNGSSILYTVQSDIQVNNDYYCLNSPKIQLSNKDTGLLEVSLEIFYFNEDCIDNIIQLMQENAKLNDELNSIKSSKSYKVARKLRVVK